MGKSNRQRRAAEQGERDIRQRAPFTLPPPSGSASMLGVDEIERLVIEGAGAGGRGGIDAFLTLTSARADSRTVDEVCVRQLEGAVASLWQRGWQPGDIVRATRKQAGADHARLAAAIVLSQARSYETMPVSPRWQSQLDELGARWWAAGPVPLATWRDRAKIDRSRSVLLALELLGLLARAPRLPKVEATPGEAMAGAPGSPDERVLARVRALLAKAESTTFADEGDALVAKAQELIARHSIDQALLGAAQGAAPAGRRVGVDDPYASAKATLLACIAHANRCRAVWIADLRYVELFGFDSDLDAVELLFTSLLVQATSSMFASAERFGASSRRPSFRRSFIIGFASRIGERLREAAAASQAGAVADHGDALLPVLATRSDAIDAAFDAAYPNLGRMRTSVSSPLGLSEGIDAADRAALGDDELSGRSGLPA
jgi:hypothetical protein